MTYNKQKAFIVCGSVLLWGLISCSPEKTHNIATGDLVRIPTIIHEDGTKLSFTQIDPTLGTDINKKPILLHTHDVLSLEPVTGDGSDLAETRISTTCVVTKDTKFERVLTDKNTLPFSQKNYVFQLFSKSFLFNENTPTLQSLDCNFKIRVVAKGGSTHDFVNLAKTQVVFGASIKPSVKILDDGNEATRDAKESIRIDYNHLSVDRVSFVDPRITRGELLCDNKIAPINPSDFGRAMDRLLMVDRSDIRTSTTTQQNEQHCRVFGYVGESLQPEAMSDLILMNMAAPPLTVTELPLTQYTFLYSSVARSVRLYNTSGLRVIAAIPTGARLLQNIVAQGKLDNGQPNIWSQGNVNSWVRVIGTTFLEKDGYIYLDFQPGASAQVDVTIAPVKIWCDVHPIITFLVSTLGSEAPIYILRSPDATVEATNITSTMRLYKKEVRPVRLMSSRGLGSAAQGALMFLNLPTFAMTKDNYNPGLCEIW